ncbi:Pr6Pr family membrane protein [Marivita hallyeonensis]|uniref:FAR-17a/AIG1-like protein n=1 Tax=Marivita hallyeonensis TaxID=996342 RepID=A0A1M5TMX3_9RHOB|nr:Pr6Pr family membrane protein [Marivita hallyeonensis]SHH52010.1 hypothetical protein SAMN05443551_2293 [Marivita hallyeonensis]
MTIQRAAAFFIALGVFLTLATRVWLRIVDDGETFGEAVWAIYRFYTIWTNTLIGFVCVGVAFGRAIAPQRLSNLLLSIIIVAVVYHALLAHLNDFTGLDWVIDAMLHTVIPTAFVVFWLIFVPKDTHRYTDILPWLGLPLVYCLYAMARAQVDGVYPYFFLNLADLGAIRTGVNIVGLLIAFAVIGALIVLVARRLGRFSERTSEQTLS